MIRVTYTKYRNDYDRKDEKISFYNLKELEDWLFNMKTGSYERNMYFTSPDRSHYYDGKLQLDSSCISSNDGKYDIWVQMIENDDGIMYSTGRYTNGICHWNDQVKDFLRSCRKRQKGNQFNFV